MGLALNGADSDFECEGYKIIQKLYYKYRILMTVMTHAKLGRLAVGSKTTETASGTAAVSIG